MSADEASDEDGDNDIDADDVGGGSDSDDSLSSKPQRRRRSARMGKRASTKKQSGAGKPKTAAANAPTGNRCVHILRAPARRDVNVDVCLCLGLNVSAVC